MLNYLFSSLFSPSPALSALVSTGYKTCTVNGQTVDCAQAFGPLVGAFFGFYFVIIAVLIVISIVSYWRIYEKAGQPGWAAIIPIYNLFALMRIVNRPAWWILLLFIPFVNVVIGIMIVHRLSRSFGHDIGFTLGLIFLSPIFYLILAFDKSAYQPIDAPAVATA